MKIAFITPFPPYRGGISKHSENLYNALQINHDVDVYNFKRQYPNILFPGKSQYQTSTKDNLNSFRIIDTINPLSWNKTAKQVIKLKYDVVLFRYWHPFFIPAYNSIINTIRQSKNGVKIFAICDNIIPHESYSLQKILIKKFIDKLDGVITMSENVNNELKNINPKINSKCLFLPILDDLPPLLDSFESRETLCLDIDKKVLLFFGLIRDYKGLDILLHSIGSLNNKILDSFQLLVVGESYENINKYKKIVKEYAIEENIVWINEYVPDNKISLYFSACDYVVLPYKTASQSGIIPMAYNYNKPVITSNIEGIKDQVINGKTGFLFESEDAKSLKELLEKIILDLDIDDSLEKLIDYKEKFSTKNLANNIIEFIK